MSNFNAYPTAWAEHAALREAAGRWQRRHLLTVAQRAAIEAAYPQQYYRPGNWLRLGLLGATAFGASSSVSGVLVVLGFSSYLAASLLLLLGCLGLLEVVIHQARHYYSGVDNALLYCALASWVVFWMQLLDLLPPTSLGTAASVWVVGGPTLLVLLLALVRYADPVVAAAAFGTAGVLLGTALLAYSWGLLALPFALALAAGALLVLLRRLAARADYLYYRSALGVLRTLALATLYLAGNYWALLDVVAEPSAHPLPGWLMAFFWLPTLLVPLLYLGLGLRRPDRLLLWLGVLGLAFSIYTFRLHYAVLPPAIAATLAGAVLLALALGALRYLRTPRHGLTAEADDEVRPPVSLETFLTAETAHVPAAPVPGFEFGGGSTGGGGAEGRF